MKKLSLLLFLLKILIVQINWNKSANVSAFSFNKYPRRHRYLLTKRYQERRITSLHLWNDEVDSNSRIKNTREKNIKYENFLSLWKKSNNNILSFYFMSATIILFTTIGILGLPPTSNDNALFFGNRANALEEEITKPAPPSTLSSSSSTGLIEEIWTIVDKYYIDKTFNNQNWADVKTKYISKSIHDSPEEDMKLATEMIASLGDKYSRMLSTQAYEAIQKYDLIGVGATLMPDSSKQIMIGAPPVKNSAAYKAGLEYGDYIVAVNGVKTQGRTSFDIIDQLNEDNSAQVTFTVKRILPSKDSIASEEDRTSQFDVTLPRTFQKVRNPISYKITENRADGTTVAYIRIAEFNSLVNQKLKEALVDLEQNLNANAYVIDLRSNPGGAFQSAVEISSYFLGNDVLATKVLDNNLQAMPFKTSNNMFQNQLLIVPEHPIILWVDKSTASAAEVFVTALRDNCRAQVIGKEKSFGKGLIQAVYGLKNGSGLVLSVAKYVSPNGNEIQGKGIIPDVYLRSSSSPSFILSTIFPDTSFVKFDPQWNNICSSNSN